MYHNRLHIKLSTMYMHIYVYLDFCEVRILMMCYYYTGFFTKFLQLNTKCWRLGEKIILSSGADLTTLEVSSQAREKEETLK